MPIPRVATFTAVVFLPNYSIAIPPLWVCIITVAMIKIATTCTNNIIVVVTGIAPNCGGMKKEQWIEDLTAQLFPTAYYHVVFTVPHEFNSLTPGNRRQLYNLLFDAASATLLQLAADPQWLGATCGITAVLHTPPCGASSGDKTLAFILKMPIE